MDKTPLPEREQLMRNIHSLLTSGRLAKTMKSKVTGETKKVLRGADEAKLSKAQLGWNEEAFIIPEDAQSHFASLHGAQDDTYSTWTKLFNEWCKSTSSLPGTAVAKKVSVFAKHFRRNQHRRLIVRNSTEVEARSLRLIL